MKDFGDAAAILVVGLMLGAIAKGLGAIVDWRERRKERRWTQRLSTLAPDKVVEGGKLGAPQSR
jgi:hypothetical protein